MWDNGVITKVAAVGDPAPGGGTFSFLGTESAGFQDGPNIPVGPIPDINDSDQIAFRAIVSGGITERGIVVRACQVDKWYVKVPDPTPIGARRQRLLQGLLQLRGLVRRLGRALLQ
jgi:hypothetical protein